MSSFQIPGVLCDTFLDKRSAYNRFCRSTSTNSQRGPVDSETPSKESIERHKNYYLNLARSVSYLMQAKSHSESAWNSINEFYHDLVDDDDEQFKPMRVQNHLGGAFLRMYLDHRVDPALVEEAGKYMMQAPTFLQLQNRVSSRLQREANKRRLVLDGRIIQSVSDRYLKAVKKGKKGIAFKHTLNTVIGGIGGIEAVGASYKSQEQIKGKYIRYTWTLSVKFSDTYDFENKRYGEYDRYRKDLAHLLQQNKFDDFNNKLGIEVQFWDNDIRKTKLDNAAIFAAYMYAIEKRGWTKGGLYWEVTLPMDVSFDDQYRIK